MSIAIITPSKNRLKLIERSLRRIMSQTVRPATWVVVHDGPSEDYRRFFEKLSQRHSWIHYAETPVETSNWGLSPRMKGLDIVLTEGLGKYVVFWDDDNYWFDDALAKISKWLENASYPECLLMPIYRLRHDIAPKVTSDLRNIEFGNIDYGNMVLKSEFAQMCFVSLKEERDRLQSHHLRGQDHQLYEYIVAMENSRIEFANTDPIAIYDGLRRLSYWRFKLGIPPLGLMKMFPRWAYLKRRLFR